MQLSLKSIERKNGKKSKGKRRKTTISSRGWLKWINNGTRSYANGTEENKDKRIAKTWFIHQQVKEKSRTDTHSHTYTHIRQPEAQCYLTLHLK